MWPSLYRQRSPNGQEPLACQFLQNTRAGAALLPTPVPPPAREAAAAPPSHAPLLPPPAPAPDSRAATRPQEPRPPEREQQPDKIWAFAWPGHPCRLASRCCRQNAQNRSTSEGCATSASALKTGVETKWSRVRGVTREGYSSTTFRAPARRLLLQHSQACVCMSRVHNESDKHVNTMVRVTYSRVTYSKSSSSTGSAAAGVEKVGTNSAAGHKPRQNWDIR